MSDNAFFKNYNSWVNGNTFKFRNLTNQRVVPEFINSIKRLHFKFHHKKIILDFSEVETIYPYPTAAVAGYIHYFQNNLGVEFEAVGLPTYLVRARFFHPYVVSKYSKGDNCLDRIWTFTNSDEVHTLVNGILSNIRTTIECEEGVIDACTWGLNEIMDNVIQHSESSIGFIMASIHKKSKQMNVCIFDYGIGIYQSLKKSKNHNPKNAPDAISLAIQEGVTRDKKIGQGNGMWGLYNIVNINSGLLSIISGKGGLSFAEGIMKTFDIIQMLSHEQQATTVNFCLKLDNATSVKKALNGHELVDMYIENMEDQFDRLVFKIANASSGTGTRQSGLKLKNEVINLYKSAHKPIVIDFEDIGIISSSFADEFIGKLVVELGFFQFQKIYTLTNMNMTVQAIVQRSLSQRLAQSIL
jgi:hypothetical protein